MLLRRFTEYLYTRYPPLGMIVTWLYPDSAVSSLERLQPPDDRSKVEPNIDAEMRFCCSCVRASKVSPTTQGTSEEGSRAISDFILRLRDIPVVGRFVSNSESMRNDRESQHRSTGHSGIRWGFVPRYTHGLRNNPNSKASNNGSNCNRDVPGPDFESRISTVSYEVVIRNKIELSSQDRPIDAIERQSMPAVQSDALFDSKIVSALQTHL
jgi:hypothetical protein